MFKVLHSQGSEEITQWMSRQMFLKGTRLVGVIQESRLLGNIERKKVIAERPSVSTHSLPGIPDDSRLMLMLLGVQDPKIR